MNDRELERLIRMAHEAEALERSAEQPALRLVGGGIRRWVAGLGIGAAAAASLLGAIVIMHQSMGPGKSGKIVTRETHSAPRPAPSGGDTTLVKNEPEQCMVLAVYRNADGQCSCLQLKEHEWGGRSLADVPKRELVDLALREACSSDAHQVLVVAVEDKPGALPKSREDAEAIAAKLSEAPSSGKVSDVSSYAYAAMPTLSSGATVVAERVAVRAAPLKQAAALIGTTPPWELR
jgi:hypothetical protein